MANPKEVLHGKPPEGNIRWAVPRELDAFDLPVTTIWKDRALLTQVNNGDVAVGVFALPPRESSLSRFWSAVTKRRGEAPEIVRLQIEPPVPMTDFQKGEHTRLSAMHPHVVMEDDTRYGIGLWLPKGLFGEWSEPKERASGELFGGKEVYQQRRVPAVLVRVDGQTPLAEQGI